MKNKITELILPEVQCVRGGGFLKSNLVYYAAVLSAFSVINYTPVFAQDIPTLDSLNESIIDPTAKYPDSAYTLIPVSERGENTITKYVFDKATNKLIPQNYRVELKNTQYGSGEGVKYYEWQTNEHGNNELKEVSAPSSGNITIEAKYKTNNYQTRIYNTTNQPNTNIDSTFINVSYDGDGNTIASVGGAIRNNGQLGNINSDFINNSCIAGNSYSYGPAIASSSTAGNTLINIQNINGNFIGNRSYANISSIGAIYNDDYSIIGSISGNFIGNSAESPNSYSTGGAIFNDSGSQIYKITGNFIGNYVSSGTEAFGGAITNTQIANSGVAKINSINGAFIGNYAIADTRAYGGAISNRLSSSTINDISADFIGNYTYGVSQYSQGGAIHTRDTAQIGNITGDFINNKAVSDTGSASGGAIYAIESSIDNITGSFIENYTLTSQTARGGAISNMNNATIKKINGDFYGNYSKSTADNSSSGAICNNGRIDEINGNFYKNYTSAITQAYGGAIRENEPGSIGNINGNFAENYVYSESGNSNGGAISMSNNTSIENITGDFIRNSAGSKTGNVLGGAIELNENSNINFISGNFEENTTSTDSGYSYGGAISNLRGTINEIKSDFTKNSVYTKSENARGGAIFNFTSANSTTTASIGSITGNFTENYAQGENAAGGAIYNTGTIKEIKDANFINNAAIANNKAIGGAVYTSEDLILSASEGKEIQISGNYASDKDGLRQEAIYMDNGAKLSFNTASDASFLINDIITGSDTKYEISFNGESNSKIDINNKIENALISVNNTDVTVNNASYINKDSQGRLNSLNMNSGNLSIYNTGVSPIQFESFSLQGGNINLNDVQVDLSNKEMGRISAQNYTQSQAGAVYVNDMTLLSDSETAVTPVLFADKSFKNNVYSSITELPSSNSENVLYAPIYKYGVSYNAEGTYGDDGYFVFTRGDKLIEDAQDPSNNNSIPINPSNPSNAFNPPVLSGPVTGQIAGVLAVNDNINFSFRNLDTFSKFPKKYRTAALNSNKYAINEVQTPISPISNIYDKGMWIKPYTSFETIGLKNGPKVHGTLYGSLIGFDSGFNKLKKNWYNVHSIYAGYTGSSLHFSGVDSTLNGGIIGFTETFYKNNFFTALTATTGASTGLSSTMYGPEDYAIISGGIGSKTGYNIEMKDGKFIIQPLLFMSYSFANTFDYKNAADVKIKSDAIHSMQINPSLRLILNTESGWQPYAAGGMVWNILNSSNFTADNVTLPDMSIKPFVEYGIGVQRYTDGNFTAYAQSMIRNGGRTGVALTCGLRWLVGKEKL